MPAMALILLGGVIWIHRAYFYKENNSRIMEHLIKPFSLGPFSWTT